jgi:hypothetical protein
MRLPWLLPLVIALAGCLATLDTSVEESSALVCPPPDDLPPPEALPPPDNGCGEGVQSCGLPGQAPCPVDYYCITGCCQRIDIPK